MLALDQYSKNILEILLQSEMPLSSLEIADQMKITPRMVRYRIKPLRDLITSEGKTISVKSNSGIYIDASKQWKQSYLDTNLSKAVSKNRFSLEERQDFIRFLLLICDSVITTKLIRYELSVSRVTILKDLDGVEEWFKGRRLHLERKPGYGIALIGNEFDIRDAIVDYLIAKLGGLSLAKLCRGSSVAQSMKTLKKMPAKTKLVICDYLSALEISFAWSLTTKIENGLGVNLTDNAFINAVLSLAIMIDRVKRNQIVQNAGPGFDSLEKNDQYYLALTIAQKIENSFSTTLTDAEKAYITTIISRLEYRKTVSETIGVFQDEEINQASQTLVKKILSEVSIRLHPYLYVDPDLQRELNLHLQNILDSQRISKYLRKEIIDEIRTQRPYTFSVAEHAARMIEKEIGVDMPYIEVGQLAILLISAMERICPPNRIIRNVLIVNDSGYEISDLLKTRLISEIPEIEVIKCIGPLELLGNKSITQDIDGIITTLELEKIDVPHIMVSPLLTNDEITKIKDILNIFPRTSRDSFDAISYAHLWNLLSAKTIRLDVKCKNWEEVVEQAGILLLGAGAIYPKYIKAMRDLVAENGPYVVSGPGVALLHARPDQGAKRTALSFLRLDPPVAFGHPQNDPVDLAFGLSTVDSFSPQYALKEYVDLISSKEVLSLLRSAETSEDIPGILRSMLEDNS